MNYNPNIHHRRSIRLRGYNYSQAGAYFVTICTQHRLCLFGEIADRTVHTHAKTLEEILGAFKSITTHQYAIGVKQQNWTPFSGKLWLRNYYERIIRDEDGLNAVRQYIAQNPLRWAEDAENPINL